MTMPAVPGVSGPQPQQPAQGQPQIPATQFAQTPEGGFPAQNAHQLGAPPQQPQMPTQQAPAPQPQQQFAPAAPQGQAPWGQMQPQQQAPQQSATQMVGGIPVDARGIIQAGPGVRPELVGRPLSQAIGMYGVLADQFRAQQQQPQAPQQPAQPQQPVRPTLPGQAPTMEQLQQMMRQEIQQAVGQVTLPQRLQSAAATIANEPYAQDPNVLARMQAAMAGLPDHAVANPEVWRNAYHMAVGSLVASGVQPQRSGPPQQQQAWQNGQPAQGVNGFPSPAGNPVPVTTQQLNGGQMWQPAGQQFFTEQPNGGQQQAVGQQLNPAQLAMAQKFQISPQDYASWLNGSVPLPGGGMSQ